MTELPVEFADLLLLDDMLPCDFSPFRTLEYGHYLEFFNAALVSLEGWHISFSNVTFEAAKAALPVPDAVRPRILRFADAAGICGRLGYVTFLNNAARLLPWFEKRDIPFIFQLYPGGYFEIDEPESDARLRRVLHSRLCRKVIVTQTLTQQYITEKIGCDPAKVEFIYGGVFNSRIPFDFLKDKQRYGRDKDTLDLCFVAYRYGTSLSAKGYDHFVMVATALAATDPRLRFHVVGDFTAEDMDLGEAASQFIFYGRQKATFFETFYPRMDIILSVNKPFQTLAAAFDGFPTGCCIEAGFLGVLNCLNDPLGLNIALTDERDVLLLDGDPEHTVARLRPLLNEPARLYDLAYANWQKYHDVFDVDRQLWARTRIIAAELARSEALIVRPPAPGSMLDGPAADLVSYWHDQVRNHQEALAYSNNQLRSHEEALKDTDRRHVELIEAYRDLDQRHAQLMGWYRDLEARNASLEARNASLEAAAAPPNPAAPAPGSAARVLRGGRRRLDHLLSRIGRRLS